MAVTREDRRVEQEEQCYHCGDPCNVSKIRIEEKQFCCHGCKTVYEILSANELCDYYEFESTPGITQKSASNKLFDFLENESIKNELLDFRSEDYERVTFSIPNIHCSSCIWLLENLSRLSPDILDSKVDFVKKDLTVHYSVKGISLRQLAELLDSIGYGPSINLDEKKEEKGSATKGVIVKLGVAGFCFGNVMLLSFPEYLGMQGIEARYSQFFSYLNMLLAVPVVFYAGFDYLKSAVKSLRQRFLNIDVPIALGVIVLFLRSSYEILSHTGPGYFDSLVGLIFFLLIGKWFQAKTYETLSFERDFKSYFPLAVMRKSEEKFESTQVKELRKGDEILIRNNEIIPADAILIDESASIDYSFVTGESKPVLKKKGDYIYAGGKQVGSTIRLVIQKEISHSYLTKLWNDEAFSKDSEHVSIVDKVSQYFTIAVVGLAIAGAVIWQLIDPSKTWLVFTAVLIVACPCALALSTPFTVGSVMRVFGRNKLYLKNAGVVEKMSSINHIVFDKTGTLTSSEQKSLEFHGMMAQRHWSLIRALAGNSTHPLSVLIYNSVQDDGKVSHIESYTELPGKGILGEVSGTKIRIGSAEWLGATNKSESTSVHVEVDGVHLGYFEIKSTYRKGIKELIKSLGRKFRLSVLSGDNSSQQSTLARFFPKKTEMHFDQGPDEKLEAVKEMQNRGGNVLMLGDGLNDAGALKQSDLGFAVTENISHFSPASDAILEGNSMTKMDRFLQLSTSSRRIVIWSFVISICYNAGGVSLALAGVLTPLIAAILMPLSSITVVVFTTLMVRLKALQLKLK